MSSSGLARTHTDIIHLLDQYVSHLLIRPDHIEMHFDDEKEADRILMEMNKAGFNKSAECLDTKQYCYCYTVVHCHIIRMDKNHVDRLWGEGRFELLKNLLKHDIDLTTQVKRIKDTKFLSFIMRAYDRFEQPFFITLTNMPPSLDMSNLMDQLSTPTFYHLLFLKVDNTRVLQHVLSKQSPQFCMKMIERISDQALTKALFFTHRYNHLAFQTVFFSQTAEVCTKIIEKTSPAELNDKFGYSVYLTLILDILRFQADSVFIELMKKSSAEFFVSVLFVDEIPRTGTVFRETLFETSAQYLSPESFAILLAHLNHSVVKKILKERFEKRDIYLLAKTFVNVALYQPIDNITQFIKLFDSRLDPKCFDSVCQDTLAMRALRYKYEANLSVKQKSGIKERDVDKFLADLLAPQKKEVVAGSEDEKKSSPVSEHEQKALNAFNAEVWIKIIRHVNKSDKYDVDFKTWQLKNFDVHNHEFVEHVFHPEKRHVVRKKTVKEGYKLLLSPNEKKSDDRKPVVVHRETDGFATIIIADTAEQRKLHKAGKKYEDSTKHPVTYVPSDVPVGLFGYEKNRLMVGYAFAVNPDKIKFLSIRDCGTHSRWWYSTNINDLYWQVSRARKFVCKSFKEFQARVKEQPFVTNEALVKLNRRDFLAIVIAEDTPKARKIAIVRRLYLLHHYKVNLPIIFYDPRKMQRASIYSSVDQCHDYPDLFLLYLEKTIHKQNKSALDHIRERFFKSVPRAFSFTLGYQDYTVTEEVANRILDIIKACKKTPSINGLNTIMKLLASIEKTSAPVPLVSKSA